MSRDITAPYNKQRVFSLPEKLGAKVGDDPACLSVDRLQPIIKATLLVLRVRVHMQGGPPNRSL